MSVRDRKEAKADCADQDGQEYNTHIVQDLIFEGQASMSQQAF
jgi:hypothetical protein